MLYATSFCYPYQSEAIEPFISLYKKLPVNIYHLHHVWPFSLDRSDSEQPVTVKFKSEEANVRLGKEFKLVLGAPAIPKGSSHGLQ